MGAFLKGFETTSKELVDRKVGEPVGGRANGSGSFNLRPNLPPYKSELFEIVFFIV